MSKTYYDKNYFSWQKHIGEFGGRANLIKFDRHITAKDKVIDFGCGAGYLLQNIKCAQKIGIDINPIARKEAHKRGIKVVGRISEVADNWADIIISNNALEHTQNPLKILSELKNKLKINGKIIFYIPCDSQTKKYSKSDINKHLFSWSPMNVGNLFSQAGYEVISAEPFFNKWPPFYRQIEKVVGLAIFQAIAFLYGFLSRDWIHIKVVARKK